MEPAGTTAERTWPDAREQARVIQLRAVFDQAGMMQQLGAG
jgi:hypothetical protein